MQDQGPTCAPSPTLAALIMAAGASSRFGGCKLLCSIGGQTLLQRSVELCSAANHRLLVTGAHEHTMRPFLQQPPLANAVVSVHFRDWSAGLGASIGFGVSQLPQADGILILLADQAGLERADIDALVHHWRSEPGKIVCAHYRGAPGVPAIFPQAWRSKLQLLTGDQGAKKLLLNQADLVTVPMHRAALDIDTPADWQALRDRIGEPTAEVEPDAPL